MNRDESTYESGRYVWAAIIIILAVVLAAIAFISWIVNSGKSTDTTAKNDTAGYTTTTTKSKSNQRYDYAISSQKKPNGDYSDTNPAVADNKSDKDDSRIYSAGTLADRDNGTTTPKTVINGTTNTNNPSGK